MSSPTAHDRKFSFFGLKENPFKVSPDLRFLFATPAHEKAFFGLLYRVQARQGLMVLTGEPGVGKTTLLCRLLGMLGSYRISTSCVFHPRLDAVDLFRFILEDFGVPCESHSKGNVLRALHSWLLQRYKAGDTPVVIIDDAQALPVDTLDELRLLLNVESATGKFLQIILAGQPELEETFLQPKLYPLRQCVMYRCHLPQLTLEQTSAYIQTRLSIADLVDYELFPGETVEEIYLHSKGIPRTVNLLCEQAIMNACSEQKESISPEDILRVARDFSFVARSPSLGQGNKPSAEKKPVHTSAFVSRRRNRSAFFERYLTDVRTSFRRDAHTFVSQCASFLRAPMTKTVRSPKRSGSHV
jgi:general secretion pathway protein A